MRKWALDALGKDPRIESAIHEFELRERRPLRLGPLPTIQPLRPFVVTLEVDREPVLSLRFQAAPPVLQPGALLEAAIAHRAEFASGTVGWTVLTTFIEYSQDWPQRSWEQVWEQLAIPVQARENTLAQGFTVNVNRMRN